MKEPIRDKYGNTIYLTDERWQHIVERHFEIKNLKDEVLKTIRTGKRRQDKLFPDTFYYLRACKNLPVDFTHIEVVVLSRVKGKQLNNFVVTAYPITRK